jgi:hypothetical protein
MSGRQQAQLFHQHEAIVASSSSSGALQGFFACFHIIYSPFVNSWILVVGKGNPMTDFWPRGNPSANLFLSQPGTLLYLDAMYSSAK